MAFSIAGPSSRSSALGQHWRLAPRRHSWLIGHLPEVPTVDVAAVYAMLDRLGDVARHLNSRKPDRIIQLHRDLGLQVVYHNNKEAVVVTTSPRVGNVCVRGAGRAPDPSPSRPAGNARRKPAGQVVTMRRRSSGTRNRPVRPYAS